ILAIKYYISIGDFGRQLQHSNPIGDSLELPMTQTKRIEHYSHCDDCCSKALGPPPNGSSEDSIIFLRVVVVFVGQAVQLVKTAMEGNNTSRWESSHAHESSARRILPLVLEKASLSFSKSYKNKRETRAK
ncbi:MAG: hypothetical protein AAGJ35_14235, partial [Myxococcota bacterium]